MTKRSMPASFHANLFALVFVRSYDPIRCQEPQWPRRPLAIGRRGLPLNPSRSAPGMSSTPSAQSHIRGYRSVGPHSIPSAGLPKSDYAHAAAAARPAKAGVSPKAARLAGTGAMSIRLPPAHRAEGPQPPHELGGGGGVRLRLGHAPGEHLPAAPEQALGTLPPVHPHLERDAAALGHQLRLVARLDVAPGPLDCQPPDERVAGPADPAEAHGVRARPLLRGEAVLASI